MKTLKKSLLVLPASVIGLSALAVIAADHDVHDGHDHSGHDHSHAEKKSDASSGSFKVSAQLRQEIGLETQVVEMRELADKNEAVIAIPKSSIFEQDGKTYVFAQAEGEDESFERWEVTLGASNDQFVEAVTGVFPGDTLVSESTTSVGQIEDGTFSRPVASNEFRKAELPGATEKVKRKRKQPTKAKIGNACPLNTECAFARTGRDRSVCDQELRVQQGQFLTPPVCETAPWGGQCENDYPRHFYGDRDQRNRYGYRGYQRDHNHRRGW